MRADYRKTRPCSRDCPVKIWIFIAVSFAVTLNVAFLTRSDSPYSHYPSPPRVELVNRSLDERKLTRASTQMVIPVRVRGEVINRSSKKVTRVDLGIEVFSCPKNRDSAESSCTLAFEATISPVVLAGPEETKPFEEWIYLSPSDLPVKRPIELKHTVRFVHRG